MRPQPGSLALFRQSRIRFARGIHKGIIRPVLTEVAGFRHTRPALEPRLVLDGNAYYAFSGLEFARLTCPWRIEMLSLSCRPAKKRPLPFEPRRVSFPNPVGENAGVLPGVSACRTRRADPWFLARRTGQTVMDDASLSKTRWCGLVTSIALAAAAAGCSTYIGTTPKSFLLAAKQNTDPNIRYVAYAKLGSPSIYENDAQKDEAVRMLITRLEEAKEPVAVRAVIVRSLGNLRDRHARQEIIKSVNDFENAVIRVEACRALGKVGLPEDATMLAQNHDRRQTRGLPDRGDRGPGIAQGQRPAYLPDPP